MRIELKEGIWDDKERMRKVLDRISAFTMLMFGFNAFANWGKWWMFGFNTFFCIIMLIIQMNKMKWDKEQYKKEVENGDKLTQKPK